MVRRIKSLDKIPLDVIEALKRARIRSGHFPISPSQARKKKKRKKSELAKLTTKAHDVLFEANTVFPFILFPDTIILDREKLTIVNRTFFKVAKKVSVMIGDIQNVEANTGPFFGSISIRSKYFSPKNRSINYLGREDARRLRRLLQGYIIAHEEKVNCSELEKDRLVTLLEELGKS